MNPWFCRIAALILIGGLVVQAGAQTTSLTSQLSMTVSQDGQASFTVTGGSFNTNFNRSSFPAPSLDGGDYPDSVTFNFQDGASFGHTVTPGTPSVLVQSGNSIYTSASSQLIVATGDSSLDIPVTGSYTQSVTLNGGNFDGQTFSATAFAANLPAVTLFAAGTYDTFTGGNVVGIGDVAVSFASMTAVPEEATGVTRLLSLHNATTSAFTLGLTPVQVSDTFYIFNTNLLALGNSYTFSLSEAYQIDGITYRTNTRLDFTTVPEPSAYAVIAGSLGLVGVLIRRRRKA